ncbi:MAG TPA: replication initiator [Acidimicrobiales bacterium]|nr:replication initiator [Acidimicrobiales bacterium]
MAFDQIPPEVLAEALERVGSPGWDRFSEMLDHTGGCAQPVRLKGRVAHADIDSGELQLAYDSSAEPDGVLLKACQSRRATRCPSCAATYRSDARALVLAGLVGGKGVPEEVAGRPLVFVTLTAPSFGPVHFETTGTRACHPGAFDCRCGDTHRCRAHHSAGDPALGRPLCIEGYDYAGAVIWNNRVTELWRRTTIATRRELAGLLGTTARTFDQSYRLAYLKVVEYQVRGLIHIHALLRLDPLDRDGDQHDAAMLATAVLDAAGRVAAPNPVPERPAIRWGPRIQVDVVAIDGRPRLAGYLSKYTTKSIDAGGALDRRLRREDLARLPVDEHLGRLVKACWDLGADPRLPPYRFREWAHTLGFRGHWLTKSPNWSTTLTALRQARHNYQLQRIRTEPASGVPLAEWTYAGQGHQADGDAWLAESTAAQQYRNRRIAWEER